MYRKMTRLALGAKCGRPARPLSGLCRPPSGTAAHAFGSINRASATEPRPSEVRPRKVRRVRRSWDSWIGSIGLSPRGVTFPSLLSPEGADRLLVWRGAEGLAFVTVVVNFFSLGVPVRRIHGIGMNLPP